MHLLPGQLYSARDAQMSLANRRRGDWKFVITGWSAMGRP